VVAYAIGSNRYRHQEAPRGAKRARRSKSFLAAEAIKFARGDDRLLPLAQGARSMSRKVARPRVGNGAYKHEGGRSAGHCTADMVRVLSEHVEQPALDWLSRPLAIPESDRPKERARKMNPLRTYRMLEERPDQRLAVINS
jgi:hypothetical protein